jgi:predicted HicB family RNase H-like nuclease
VKLDQESSEKSFGVPRFNLRWTEEVRQSVKVAAARAGVSVGAWLLAAIDEKLARDEKGGR